VHRLTLRFSEDVSRALAASDLNLRDLLSGVPVGASEMSLSFDDDGTTAVITFPALGGGRLPAGTWRLSVAAAGVTDRAGNALGAPFSRDFVVNSAMAGRHLFYNNSAFDLNDPAAGEADDAAIAGRRRCCRWPAPKADLRRFRALPSPTCRATRVGSTA
jgi:hypothetical protein